MAFVLDASMALSWHFEDESSDAAEAVAQRAFVEGVLVPRHWFLELVSGLLKGERRRRTSSTPAALFMERVGDLDIVVDQSDADLAVRTLLPLARALRLSAYDAAYLELAQREGVALATFDGPLSRAARQVGVEVLTGEVE